MENKNNHIPRRFIESKMTRQELLIIDSIKSIEEQFPANDKLTQVVATLAHAKDMLSDYTDQVMGVKAFFGMEDIKKSERFNEVLKEVEEEIITGHKVEKEKQETAFDTGTLEKVLLEKQEEVNKPIRKVTIVLMNGEHAYFDHVLRVELNNNKSLIVTQAENKNTVFRYDNVSHYSVYEE